MKRNITRMVELEKKLIAATLKECGYVGTLPIPEWDKKEVIRFLNSHLLLLLATNERLKNVDVIIHNNIRKTLIKRETDNSIVELCKMIQFLK